MERFSEDDFKEYVEDLIESDRIEGKEAGIAKLAIDQGYNSLSDKQRFVFDKTIKENSVELCERCGAPIPWSEMIEALDNGGYCNYCQHMMEKDD